MSMTLTFTHGHFLSSSIAANVYFALWLLFYVCNPVYSTCVVRCYLCPQMLGIHVRDCYLYVCNPVYSTCVLRCQVFMSEIVIFMFVTLCILCVSSDASCVLRCQVFMSEMVIYRIKTVFLAFDFKGFLSQILSITQLSYLNSPERASISLSNVE